ncbi:MAG: hypothetical protein ABEH90_02315 [Halolamina sp.]
MATHEAADDASTQVADISIDLDTENEDASGATVTIPSAADGTVQATVEPTADGRWRCEFQTRDGRTAVTRTVEEDPASIEELLNLLAPALNIIETVLREAGC